MGEEVDGSAVVSGAEWVVPGVCPESVPLCPFDLDGAAVVEVLVSLVAGVVSVGSAYEFGFSLYAGGSGAVDAFPGTSVFEAGFVEPFVVGFYEGGLWVDG